QRPEQEAVVLVLRVGVEPVVDPDVHPVVDDGDVVGDGGQFHLVTQGRSRRIGTGLVHQRPENRHAGGASWPPSTTGRGHTSSMAATIAATSSREGEVFIGACYGLVG